MRRERWAQALEAGKKQDQNIAADLRAADRGWRAPSSHPGAARRVFQGRTARASLAEVKTARLTTKDLREKSPALEDDLRREQDRLLPLRQRRRAALTLERSAALFVVARSILAAFARMKAERGALDFNDQIVRALGAGDAVERRLGAAQARLWARSPAARRSPGRVSAAMGHSCGAERRVFRRRRRAAEEPHRLRGRRREAVHLRLPGRGAPDVRGNEARIRRAPSPRRAAIRRRAR